jgi:hypothetical protein
VSTDQTTGANDPDEDAGAHPPPPDQLGSSGATADRGRVDDHESPAQPERPERAKPLRAFLDYLSPEPEHPPKRFPEPFEDLAAKLATDDAELAAELLADAEALFAEPNERIESAERRATTLQGAVAIAAAVTVTGGGLLLDPDKIEGKCWQIAFAIGLAALVMTLVATAVRALGATAKRVTVKSPSHDDGVYHRRRSRVRAPRRIVPRGSCMPTASTTRSRA